MDRHRRVAARRLLALVASTLLGLSSAAALASPASADGTEVSGHCTWDAAAAEWVVNWTINPVPPDGATSYELVGHEAEPPDTVDDLDPGEDTFAPVTGEQRLSGDASTASLRVYAEWVDVEGDALGDTEWYGEVAIPVDCEAPKGADLLNGFSYDCESLTITVTNPDSESVRLNFIPRNGDTFGVDVAGGESANVRFPPVAGQSVDVRLDGRSIVDPAEPIEITAADRQQLDCDEEESAETAGLAATGSRVALVAGAALALLALGGGLYLVARRRRIRFTA